MVDVEEVLADGGESVKVLVVGSGGREHALAWKLAQSPRAREIVVAPGNAGMESIARSVPCGLAPADLLALARQEQPDLIVIGPEAPLVAGAAEQLEREGHRVFGPNSAAARLEGSKSFAKEFMVRHGIPTAGHRVFADRDQAQAYLRERGAPVVIKDSSLAGGKGVTVATTLPEAEAAVERVFSGGGGEAVVEEVLRGQEISYLVFTDGRDFCPMPLAQDYKQAEEGDRGAMTGGMGAVAPVSLLSLAEQDSLENSIVRPTLTGLIDEGVEYRGVLYFGLMLTDDGPKLLEYNVRLGDPETQVVLPLLADDLLDVLEAVIDRRLAGTQLHWKPLCAACVVMAAPGYPGAYATGTPLQVFEPEERLLAFHAGTSAGPDGLVSNGGRVLGVTALASGVREAVAAAYRGVDRVTFPGAHYRRDIGSRLGG